jgi:hypothetical protein
MSEKTVLSRQSDKFGLTQKHLTIKIIIPSEKNDLHTVS